MNLALLQDGPHVKVVATMTAEEREDFANRTFAFNWDCPGRSPLEALFLAAETVEAVSAHFDWERSAVVLGMGGSSELLVHLQMIQVRD